MKTKNFTEIIRNQEPKSVIVIPDEPFADVTLCDPNHIGYADLNGRGYHDNGTNFFEMTIEKESRLLAEYIAKASGATLQIKRESEVKDLNMIRIHVGFTRYVKEKEPQIENLGNDGFILDSTNPQNIILVGLTYWSIKFAICEFLERYVGIRWLFPGAKGEDIPEQKTINIVHERLEQKPAYYSRLLSGLNGTDLHVWARFNRMHGNIAFHHNLYKLFSPVKYAKTHPHFFPVQNNKRFLPDADSKECWQPCLTSDGIIEEAIKSICTYFDNNPDINSYSLGINDGGGFCECSNCKTKKGNKVNFLGVQDLSDYYFEWCNKVVKGVLLKHPNKYFGCIAYQEIATAPQQIKLDEHIMPFMTYDRLQYADPDLRRINLEYTQNWLKSVSNLGWYDYIYGTPYSIPRVYFHQMAEFLKLGFEIGVKAFYAEAYPNIGEGPKFYLTLKLLWNPHADVDSILEDWYRRMVGENAAGYLAEYYTLWEKIWVEKMPKCSYFQQDLEQKVYGKKFEYLNIEQINYLDAISIKDIEKSRRLLELVCKNTETDLQKVRAKILMKAFEFYEISALAYITGKKSLDKTISTESEALESLEEGVSCFQMVEKRNHLVWEEFSKDSLFCFTDYNNIDRSPENLGYDWGQSAIWNALPWYSKSEKIKERIINLSNKSENKRVQQQIQFMLMTQDSELKPISANPYFEEGDNSTAKNWIFNVNAGKITRTNKISCTGNFSICCEGVKKGVIISDLPVNSSAGTYGVTAKVFYPNKPSKNSKIWVTIIPLGLEGQKLRRFLPEIPILAKPESGKWNTIGSIATIGEEIRKKKVKSLQLIVHIQDLEPEEKVYIDSAAIYQI